MYAYCLGQEQAAYDDLKQSWSTLSGNVRTSCLREWGQASEGKYRMLKYCRTQQSTAERANGSSGFKW